MHLVGMSGHASSSAFLNLSPFSSFLLLMKERMFNIVMQSALLLFNETLKTPNRKAARKFSQPIIFLKFWKADCHGFCISIHRAKQ